MRYRMFRMWQRSGEIPFSTKEKQTSDDKGQHFFTGSFDSIPFLNEQAKRTFVHLLLRPGYMIRDYLYGKREIYLAPFTALIIFYAFFATLMSVIAPNYINSTPDWMEDNYISEDMKDDAEYMEVHMKTLNSIREIYIWTHLDLYPDRVDTKLEASVAAVEGNLRFQGFQYFIHRFLALWLILWIQFRWKRKLSISAAATMAAYFLCQVCFIVLFESLIIMGDISDYAETFTIGAILIYNYRQLFDMKWSKSILNTLFTGLLYLILQLIVAILIVVGIIILAIVAMF